MKNLIKYGLLFLSVFYSFSSSAQLKSGNILGDLGLNAGTQGPSSNVSLPVYYYNINSFYKAKE